MLKDSFHPCIQGSERKDYKQAALVAKKILTEPTLNQDLAGIIAGLPEDHRQKMTKNARAAAEYVERGLKK